MSDWLLCFGTAVASSLDAASKAVLWSIESLTGDESSTREPAYGPLGWFGRPRPPVAAEDATPTSPAGECEVLAWRPPGDDRTYIIASKDLRLSAKVNPIDGELGMVGYDGGFISIRPNVDENGSTITLYAPRNVDPPKASLIQMVSTDGNQQIAIEHESGQSVVLNPDGQVLITGSTAAGPSQGNSWIAVDETDGVVINAEKCALNAAVMLGDKDPALGQAVVLEGTPAFGFAAWVIYVNAALNGLGAPGPTPAQAPQYTTKVKAI
jgi:hypothetical protein